MHPETQRRLEQKLNEDSYSCEQFCGELPFHIWNTCPLCFCGLLPVLVVCFSAICRLDYATHVTDIGAQIVNRMGLSYTVYYTAGCWPAHERNPAIDWTSLPSLPSQQCNEARFEIAAGEFDAISGSPLRVRNVTALQARQIVSVKVTPDWRFITFMGSIKEEVGNLYVVSAMETDATQAIPLLGSDELKALDAQCQIHSDAIRRVVRASPSTSGVSDAPARLAGFKNLQVIIPGMAPLEFGGDLTSLPTPPEGSSLTYRAAFSFQCKQQQDGSGFEPFEFSKVAMVDFRLDGLNITRVGQPAGTFAWAQSQLVLLDTVPNPPRGGNRYVNDAVERFHSQSCPRFVPSKQGSQLLFVAEDVAPATKRRDTSVWHEPTVIPSRVLATAEVPFNARRLEDSQRHHAVGNLKERRLKRRLQGEDLQDDSTKVASDVRDQTNPVPDAVQTAISQAAQAELLNDLLKANAEKAAEIRQKAEQAVALTAQLRAGSKEIMAASQILDIGPSEMPFAPVYGCPEFVPSLYFSTPSLAETVEQNLFNQKALEGDKQQTSDTFVVMSDPSSFAVLGIDAQVVSGSLPQTNGPATGEVLGVKLLYNVESAIGTGGKSRLRIDGCQPIRAAGLTGHVRLQFALESVMETFQVENEKNIYTAWLACLTADQRIAIVQSPKQEHWINMSMPFPMWTGRTDQAVWCPEDHEDSCFEVWSNPNPNE